MARFDLTRTKSLPRHALQRLPHLLGIEAQQNLPAFHQNGPLDQVRMFGHERDRLGASRRRVLHVFLTIELIAGIEKHFVIAIPNEQIQLLLAQAAIQIDLLEGRSGLAKKTLRVTAGSSSRLQIKLDHT